MASRRPRYGDYCYELVIGPLSTTQLMNRLELEVFIGFSLKKKEEKKKKRSKTIFVRQQNIFFNMECQTKHFYE